MKSFRWEEQLRRSFQRHAEPVQPILTKAPEEHQALVKRFVLDSAAGLPAVSNYRKLKAKDTGLAKIIDAAELDLSQAKLDKARALQKLDGEKLTAALVKIDAKREAAESKIAECRKGQQLFKEEVANARKLALDAVMAHPLATYPALHAEVMSRLHAAEAAVEAKKEFFALVDEAAVASQAKTLHYQLEHTINPQLEALLDAEPAVPESKAPDGSEAVETARAAQSEPICPPVQLPAGQ